jgi:hypothetical protein
MRLDWPPPTQWRIKLKSGEVLGVLADMYHEEKKHYIFSMTVHAPQEQLRHHDVMTTTSGWNPRAVNPETGEAMSFIAVAKVPIKDVARFGILAKDWAKPTKNQKRKRKRTRERARKLTAKWEGHHVRDPAGHCGHVRDVEECEVVRFRTCSSGHWMYAPLDRIEDLGVQAPEGCPCADGD